MPRGVKSLYLPAHKNAFVSMESVLFKKDCYVILNEKNNMLHAILIKK